MLQELHKKISNGETALADALIGMKEGFQAEFKQKEKESQAELSSTDRKNIAKAVCGFANANGGTLIFGVKTKKRDGLDVIDSIQCLQDAERLRAYVEASIPELIDPNVEDVQVFSLKETDGSGVIGIEVPRSENRPHMSVAKGEKRYYRRFDDGTRAMDHWLVRDAFMASKSAELKIEPSLKMGSVREIENLTLINFQFHVSLKNIGNTAAQAPFIRLTRHPKIDWQISNEGQFRILLENGNVGKYWTNDEVLHSGEFLGSIFFNFGIFINESFELYSGDPENFFASLSFDQCKTVTLPCSKLSDVGRQTFDEFNVNCVYGAINAQYGDMSLEFDKTKILKIASKSGLLEFAG